MSAWGLLFFVCGVAFLVQHGKRSDALAEQFNGAEARRARRGRRTTATREHPNLQMAEDGDNCDVQMGERPLLEEHALSNDDFGHDNVHGSDETII